jgi:hypothetical protein
MQHAKDVLAKISKSVDETKELFDFLETAFGLSPTASTEEESEAVRALGGAMLILIKAVCDSCEHAAKLREIVPELAKVAGLKIVNVVAAGGLPPPPPPPEPEPDPTVPHEHNISVSLRKNPHALALGRLGWSKGGIARAQSLSPEARSLIAQNAANARWLKKNK